MADRREEDQAEGPAMAPSDLDENSHAEMRLLYRDASQAMRFAKDRQWKLVGTALLVFLGIMAIPEFLEIAPLMAKGLVLASFLVSAATIYVLVIYQIGQNGELGRLHAVGERFSSLFRNLAGVTAKRESKLHGHIILFFMVAGVLLANGVSVVFLARLYL